jgi:hypothetical protein
MKHTELAEKKSKSNGSSPKKRLGSQYAVCINNEGYPASLELRKIYSILTDKTATKSGLIRVVDESGEDYLYPSDYFVAIKLPRAVEKAVQLVS